MTSQALATPARRRSPKDPSRPQRTNDVPSDACIGKAGIASCGLIGADPSGGIAARVSGPSALERRGLSCRRCYPRLQVYHASEPSGTQVAPPGRNRPQSDNPSAPRLESRDPGNCESARETTPRSCGLSAATMSCAAGSASRAPHARSRRLHRDAQLRGGREGVWRQPELCA